MTSPQRCTFTVYPPDGAVGLLSNLQHLFLREAETLHSQTPLMSGQGINECLKAWDLIRPRNSRSFPEETNTARQTRGLMCP